MAPTESESKTMKPPNTISIKFCPICGRDDQFRPFTTKYHSHRGYRCTGTPIKVTYTRTEA